MDFPKNNKKLSEIFAKGTLPKAEEYGGEYAVDMRTGFIPSLLPFHHRKRYFIENGVLKSYNVLFKNFIFGHFTMEKGQANGFIPNDVLVFNYNQKQNSFIFRPIRDHVRLIEPDVYLGRLNYTLFGRLVFIGYFTLIKIK